MRSVAFLQVAKENLHRLLDVLQRNETQTRRLVIEPALAAIGYDVWKADAPNRLEAEATIDGAARSGGKGAVDYVLFASGSPYTALEAKSVGVSLSAQDSKQVCDYCVYRQPQLRWGVVTNGKDWRLFDNEIKGAPDRRCFLEWNLDGKLGNLVHLLSPSRAENLVEVASSIQSIPARLKKNFLLTVLQELPSSSDADDSEQVRIEQTPVSKPGPIRAQIQERPQSPYSTHRDRGTVPGDLTGSKPVFIRIPGEEQDDLDTWSRGYARLANYALKIGVRDAILARDLSREKPYTGTGRELSSVKLEDGSFLLTNYNAITHARKILVLAQKLGLKPGSMVVRYLDLNQQVMDWHLP